MTPTTHCPDSSGAITNCIGLDPSTSRPGGTGPDSALPARGPISTSHAPPRPSHHAAVVLGHPADCPTFISPLGRNNQRRAPAPTALSATTAKPAAVATKNESDTSARQSFDITRNEASA